MCPQTLQDVSRSNYVHTAHYSQLLTRHSEPLRRSKWKNSCAGSALNPCDLRDWVWYSARKVGRLDESRDAASLSVKITKPKIYLRAHWLNVTYWQIQVTEQLHGQQCEGGKGMQRNEDKAWEKIRVRSVAVTNPSLPQWCLCLLWPSSL